MQSRMGITGLMADITYYLSQDGDWVCDECGNLLEDNEYGFWCDTCEGHPDSSSTSVSK